MLAAAVGLQLSMTGVTVAVKLRAACEQLGIDAAGLTLPAALHACNTAMGMEQSGPLIAQTDALIEQLGLGLSASPLPVAAEEQQAIEKPDAVEESSSSVRDVMSNPVMVNKFMEESVSEEDLARALACQFWAPNHKLKGSWRFVQLGHVSRMAAAGLNAGQDIGRKAQARLEELQHLPGCLVVVCKAFYEAADRLEKEEQRALTAVHNVALGLVSQGLGVKWVTGPITENYELWELVGLEPNEEVVVGLLWYGWPAKEGVRPVKDGTSLADKLTRLA